MAFVPILAAESAEAPVLASAASTALPKIAKALPGITHDVAKSGQTVINGLSKVIPKINEHLQAATECVQHLNNLHEGI